MVHVGEEILNSLVAKFEALQSEVEQLRMETARQEAEIGNLQTKLQATSPLAPIPSKVSRRKLLRNMAMVAAGTVATGAALASGNGQVHADGIGTVAGASTAVFGFTAAPQGVTPHQPGGGLFGVIGVTDDPGISVSDNSGVLGYSTAGFGVQGISRDVSGVFGISSSTNNAVAGVYGYSGSTNGVIGLAAAENVAGVRGSNSAVTGIGYGVYGISNNANGTGVYGTGNTGVYGQSSAASRAGVQGFNTNAGGYGVYGNSTGYGVYGVGNIGVYGQSSNSNQAGVYGTNNTANGIGVWGVATNHYGVYGISLAAGRGGVLGTNDNATGYGVTGTSVNGTGVYGLSNATGRGGVRGVNSANNGWGVYGSAADGTGVYGVASNAAYAGVTAFNPLGDGLTAYCGQNATNNAAGKSAAYGFHQSTEGVTFGIFGRAISVDGYGVFGYNNVAGVGIGADSNGGVGAEFKGTLAPLRLVPKAAAGAPTTGTHEFGEIVTSTEAGSNSNLYFCKQGGTPGIWVKLNQALNGNENDVTIAAGSNVTIDNSVPGTITINAAGGGSGGVPNVNGITAAVTIQQNGTAITPSANNINIVTQNTVFLTKPIRVAATTNSGGTRSLLSSDGTGNPNSSFQIVQISGVSVDGLSVPAGAKAIIGSLTSVGATASGNLRAWPTGAATPTVNSLNIPAKPDGTGFNLTTSIVVGLSATGQVSIGYSNGVTGSTCGFSIDISGYII
jgi:hypothetical protein